MPPHSPAHRHRDARGPLVFDTRDLGPGSARTLTTQVAAPEHLGVELARVPPGAELALDLQLEGVAEGVLATAVVTGPLAGECARCLEPFTAPLKVRFQELFVRADEAAVDDLDGTDSYRLDAGGLLDLEPALRDAVVLELPLSPRCEDGCRGLCAECGVRLADAEPGHGHEVRGALWEKLKDFQAGMDDERGRDG
jgi:uncharacterized protein